MPKRNHPGLGVECQVIFKPGHHRATDRAISIIGVKTDEVNIGVIKGVVRLRAG